MSTILSPEGLDRVVVRVSKRYNTDVKRQLSWNDASEQTLFFELSRCILGSRIRFEVAEAHAKNLFQKELLDPGSMINDPQSSQSRIENELSEPQLLAKGSSRYPFYRLRAKQIVQTVLNIYQNSSLKDLLKKATSSIDARNIIMNVACGVGMKQASLFLRNVHFCRDLAILDSRLLEFMKRRGLSEGNKIKSKKHYRTQESIFSDYSRKLGVTVGALDIAIWGVMRALDGGYQ